MELTAIGLNHQTAPVSIREKLAFAAEVLPDAVNQLADGEVAREGLILSTCNRTEIYALGNSDKIVQWLADYHDLSLGEIQPYLYVLDIQDTVRHAFRVSCGLDSMVLGEPQILGQFKDAVRVAQHQRALGSTLNMLFQRTFTVAKDIRSHTSVGANSVSMAAAAVKMAEKIFPKIADLNVLFIGAGEMIELVATYFAAKTPKQMTVANRTITRAQELSQKIGQNANAVLLTQLSDIMYRYDVVVSSTASQLPIVGKGVIEAALKKRHHLPMFLLDLAIPRDIEPQVANLADIFLYTVDDIQNIVESGKDARKKAAEKAEFLIEQKVADYLAWQKSRATVPLIQSLRAQGEQDRLYVLNNAKKQLAKGKNPEEVLEILSKQLMNKLMHKPTKALNTDNSEEQNIVKAITEIYHLKEKE